MNVITYNGLKIPTDINPCNIISAFDNPIDEYKLDKYIDSMSNELDIEYTFPPIKGFPSIITEDDLGKYFISGEEIEFKDIGKLVWYVTDGHHRSLASLKVGKKFVDVLLDRDTITNELELEKFDLYNK